MICVLREGCLPVFGLVEGVDRECAWISDFFGIKGVLIPGSSVYKCFVLGSSWIFGCTAATMVIDD